MALNAYRIGFPGWKTVGRYLGVPLKFRVYLHEDKESGSYWANSPDLDGLVVSGATLEEVKNEALAAASELLAQALACPPGRRPKAEADIRNIVDVPCAA